MKPVLSLFCHRRLCATLLHVMASCCGLETARAHAMHQSSTTCPAQTLSAPPDEAVNPEALVKTFFRTEIGTPFSNGGQHDTEESLREFMRALEADMV